jgi:serine phosphatase RsbU (regulator of sigma subunit)
MQIEEEEPPDNQELLSQELVISSLVHEVTRVLNSAASLDQALEAFLLGIMELTGLQNMALFTLRDGDTELSPTHSLGLSHESLAALNPLPAAGLIQACLSCFRHLIVGKQPPGDPFSVTQATSYLLMPITARMSETNPEMPSRIRSVGILWLDTSPPGPPLTGQSISHLSGLAQHAGLIMETFRAQRELANANTELKSSNEKLNEAYAALSEAQKVIDADLNRARIIQNSLLPSSFPTHLIQRIASKYIPAGMVGGDYYDCFELTPNSLGIVVADVSGHGIGAALVMSMFKVLLRTFSAQDSSPCSVLNRINATFMQQQLGAAKFVTAFYAIFDKAERRFTFCNAGHVAQLLRQDPVGENGPNSILELASSGLVLGMFHETFLQDATIELAPEARVFLFTDGITEAHGINGKMFGMDPMMALAIESGAEPPTSLVESLMRTRSKFLGGSEQATGELADDATLVILDL